MRGIKECLNWMIDNPNKELESEYNGVRRRYNYSSSSFEWLDEGSWLKSKEFCQFGNQEWQPYDQNPAVDFHVAYMDCLENNVKYILNNGEYLLTGLEGKVLLEWQACTILTGCKLNHDKWKKVL